MGRPGGDSARSQTTERGARSTRLFLLSFLMLFVELALIRWTGSNVVYLGYFSNFVLLGSFLGIGIGFMLAGRRVDLFAWAPTALTLLIAFVLIFPVKIDRTGNELIYFGEPTRTGLPIWVTLPVVFVAVAVVLAMIAQGVAREFVRFAPLEAYRLDILGSLAGVIAFTLLSFAGAPPVAWGMIVGLLFLFLYGSVGLIGGTTLMVLVVMLADESANPTDSWSPYYKVTRAQEIDSLGQRVILVNGIPHQAVQEIQARRAVEPIYFLPYERVEGRPLDDVLIVGAGNGTDVAIALDQGARRVDAVEIDPRLLEIGREEHPNRPYDDPRVETHVGDGRAFLERTDKRYDLILFALPDSLTLVSGQSSLRLESYLFTQESLETARDRLKPGGSFGMYNYYREQWLIDRLARTLEAAYGRPPCQDVVQRGSGLALMMASREPLSCRTAKTAGAPEPVNDDRPFLYLRTPAIPSFYLLTIGLILLVSIVAVRLAAGPLRAMSGYADLFFMGAAFLLLETKNIVQFALLFGTTWLVNALVFAGILVAVLAAIEVSRRIEIARPVRLYWLLLLSLLVAWFVPASFLLEQPFVVRFPLAVALAFTPIFLANLIFAQRFKNVAASNIAFGANLLGAMVGGLIEYSSLVIGYNSLLIVVAVVYGLALLSGRRYLRPAPAA